MTGTDGNGVAVMVVILTFDQRDATLACLESFAAVEAPPYRIVLWDNGSTDGTEDAVRDRFPDVLVHRHPENLGVASGRNAAAALATGELSPRFLFFLDNDTRVGPDVEDPRKARPLAEGFEGAIIPDPAASREAEEPGAEPRPTRSGRRRGWGP